MLGPSLSAIEQSQYSGLLCNYCELLCYHISFVISLCSLVSTQFSIIISQCPRELSQCLIVLFLGLVSYHSVLFYHLLAYYFAILSLHNANATMSPEIYTMPLMCPIVLSLMLLLINHNTFLYYHHVLLHYHSELFCNHCALMSHHYALEPSQCTIVLCYHHRALLSYHIALCIIVSCDISVPYRFIDLTYYAIVVPY